MRGFRILLCVTAICASLALVPRAKAQISFGLDIGGPPACQYGYYGYAPYRCAPYGFYGPGYFYNGIFLGMGPWANWGYGHGWGEHRFEGDGGGRFHGGDGRGWRGDGRGGYGRGDGFRGGDGGRGFNGRGNGGDRGYGGNGRGGFQVVAAGMVASKGIAEEAAASTAVAAEVVSMVGAAAMAAAVVTTRLDSTAIQRRRSFHPAAFVCLRRLYFMPRKTWLWRYQ